MYEYTYNCVKREDNTVCCQKKHSKKEDPATTVEVTYPADNAQGYEDGDYITYKDGNLDVYFNNMCKIDDYKVSFSGGKIGYFIEVNPMDIEKVIPVNFIDIVED